MPLRLPLVHLTLRPVSAPADSGADIDDACPRRRRVIVAITPPRFRAWPSPAPTCAWLCSRAQRCHS